MSGFRCTDVKTEKVDWELAPGLGFSWEGAADTKSIQGSSSSTLHKYSPQSESPSHQA